LGATGLYVQEDEEEGMRKWLVVALLLLVALILGATVLREPIASAQEGLTPVLIFGVDDQSPAPVRLDAEGNLRIHETGTARANIVGPLDSNGNVRVGVQGTMPVNVQGTVPVNVQGTVPVSPSLPSGRLIVLSGPVSWEGGQGLTSPFVSTGDCTQIQALFERNGTTTLAGDPRLFIRLRTSADSGQHWSSWDASDVRAAGAALPTGLITAFFDRSRVSSTGVTTFDGPVIAPSASLEVRSTSAFTVTFGRILLYCDR
jgi:hypothetical protein